MLYIYRFKNTINNKSYIGQTNNIENRKRNHKSAAFNTKSNEYNRPFYKAIRKYGWDAFQFEILEEIPNGFGIDYLNEREISFIDYYKSLVSENGYNIAKGGNGYKREPLSFEEKVKLSKIFTVEQIKEIQSLLSENYAYYEIKSRFPQLTDSFLSNINLGLNFRRDDLTYPLSDFHSKFSKEARLAIKAEIEQGETYEEISKKYGISKAYLSLINKGEKWHDKDKSYPLCLKGCVNGVWSKSAKYDLVFSDLSQEEIAQKYNKTRSTIAALNNGRNRKDSRLVYPLRDNQKKNKEIWTTLF